MCDPHAVGLLSDIRASQTDAPTILCYDRAPGGVGLSDEVLRLHAELFQRAEELVRDCPCESGCPSCLGPGAASNPQAKAQVLRLIGAVRG